LVAAVAREAGRQVSFLEKCGVKFVEHEGHFLASHPAGHSYPRHIRARGARRQRPYSSAQKICP